MAGTSNSKYPANRSTWDIGQTTKATRLLGTLTFPAEVTLGEAPGEDPSWLEPMPDDELNDQVIGATREAEPDSEIKLPIG